MNPVWPTRFEEQLLLACFAPEEAAGDALDRCCREWGGLEREPAVAPLLPLVHRRWPAVEHTVIELGQRGYVANWNRNRERMAELAAIGTRLGNAGIRWMALKGAALALRQYADLGLRAMADLDLLIPAEDLRRAVALVESAGYRAEEGATPDAIVRQARVRHGWQFLGKAERNLDLHWRPVNRCYSPEVTRLFWEAAEIVYLGEQKILVPSPTDQLFHVCAHGLQWDWARKTRWIADALTVLREPVDWRRISHLAGCAGMSFRLAKALEFLQERFGAPIPPDLAARLMRAAPGWERREYPLLLKPCPLGVYDSIAWHAYHFRRIRCFDDAWRRAPLAAAWTQYVCAFLDAPGVGSLWRKLRPHVMLRIRLLMNGRASLLGAADFEPPINADERR